jgi:hypothetical protein
MTVDSFICQILAAKSKFNTFTNKNILLLHYLTSPVILISHSLLWYRWHYLLSHLATPCYGIAGTTYPTWPFLVMVWLTQFIPPGHSFLMYRWHHLSHLATPCYGIAGTTYPTWPFLVMVSLPSLIMAGGERSNLAGATHYFVRLGRTDLTRATLVSVNPNRPLPKLLWSFLPCDSCHRKFHMVTVFWYSLEGITRGYGKIFRITKSIVPILT